MPISDITFKEQPSQPFLAIRTKTDNVAQTLEKLFAELRSFLDAKGISAAGQPLTIWYDCTDGVFDMDAAIPISAPAEGEGRIHAGELAKNKVATVIFTGHYDGLVDAWNEFMQAMKGRGLDMTKDPWEVYVTDPGTEPDPLKWQTELVQSIKRWKVQD